MSAKPSILAVEQLENVRVLTLNRPERHHALNYELATSIASAIDDAEADDNVRALVLTGSGDKAFCAGQDMLEMSGVEAAAGEVKSSSAAIAFERVANSTLPIIAAITGICYGGGALLALACDLRIADRASRYRFPGAEYGLVVGAAWLPRLVGTAKAKEWIYTARKIEADEALQSSLVSYLHDTPDVLPAALALAKQITENSPIAVSESKRVVDAATLVPAAEDLEREINEGLRGSNEQRALFNRATSKVTGRTI
ncbi:MAG: enoyl-CoA hydratase/isomerase family protein [Gammaproteobacteria bacterium]